MVRFACLGFLGVLASLGACGKSDGGSGPIALSDLPARVATCKQLRTADIERELRGFASSRVQ